MNSFRILYVFAYIVGIVFMLCCFVLCKLSIINYSSLTRRSFWDSTKAIGTGCC